MTTWTLTQKVIVGAVFLLLLFDAAMAIALGPDATISNAVTSWAHQYPVIPFLAGMLCGHLFWSQRPSAADRKNPERL